MMWPPAVEQQLELSSPLVAILGLSDHMAVPARHERAIVDLELVPQSAHGEGFSGGCSNLAGGERGVLSSVFLELLSTAHPAEAIRCPPHVGTIWGEDIDGLDVLSGHTTRGKRDRIQVVGTARNVMEAFH